MARKPNATPPQLQNEDTLKAGDTEEELLIDTNEPAGDVVEAEDAGVTESVDSLQEQLAAANARADREAAARAEAEKRVDSAGRQVADSNLQAIDNAISGAQASKKDLMAQRIAAKEAGDYAKEAELEDQLQTVNIKISRLGEGKAELERRIEYAKEQEELNADPLEGYIAGAKLNSSAAAWMRQNPDIILTNGNLDREKLGDLEAAHFLAVGKRHRLLPGSREYFEFIESELLGGGSAEVEEEVVPAPKSNGGRPPAAPPSRTPAAHNMGSRPNLPPGVTMTADGKYRMSAALQEAASISGMSNAEYLKNALAVHRERMN